MTTNTPSGDGATRRTILECLAREDGSLSPLEVARRSHLSTLVVVPALAGLVDDGLVLRDQRARDAGTGPVAWTYRLTARGGRVAGEGRRAG